MSDTPGTKRDDDWTLAGELALGVLAGDERVAAETRAAVDPAFARLVEDWHARLGDMAAEAAPVVPPPRVWDAIDRSLFAERSQAKGLWSNLNFWRWLSAGTGALAAVCIAFLVFFAVPPAQPPMVAALQAIGKGPLFFAHVDAASGRLLVEVVEPDTDTSHVPELWVIPGDGVPRSLGVINRTGETTIALSAALREATIAGATLAVSLEPVGGSPTGQPTGPVVAAGEINPI